MIVIICIKAEHWHNTDHHSVRGTRSTLLTVRLTFSKHTLNVSHKHLRAPSCFNPLKEGNFLCLYGFYLFLPSIPPSNSFHLGEVIWMSVTPHGKYPALWRVGRLGCLWEPLKAFSTLLQSPRHWAFCLLPWCLFGHGGGGAGPSCPRPSQPAPLEAADAISRQPL